MDKKILWFDVETGGTDEKTDALIQLSALIEIDNKIVDEIDLKMKPLPGKIVNPDAIKTHGMTYEMMRTFEDADTAFNNFNSFLLKHNPIPAKNCRYIMAGYNPDFDCRFLSQWYSDITCGPYEYWKHLQFSPIDVLPVLRAMRIAGIIDTPDTKLETICKHFGIELKAHDALSDIKATRELTKLIYEEMFTKYSSKPWGLLGEITTFAEVANV